MHEFHISHIFYSLVCLYSLVFHIHISQYFTAWCDYTQTVNELHTCVAKVNCWNTDCPELGVLLFISTVFDLPWSRLKYYFVDRVLFIATVLG